mgnify:CR=1 FL=1|tara:strand:+ start:389 stop:994 length:606 start_codon:yes stop_codon:yes gene_type:complete
MSNRWTAFQEEEQVEIPRTTSNPLRKIKKKIRQKQEKYDKNPSPELYNELLKLKEKLKIFIGDPVKKVKKKKFKKRKINKAEVAKEKKRKKEKERKERFNAEYNRWKQEQYEKNRKRLEEEERRRMYQEQQKQLEKMKFINSLPLDIINWLNSPNKKQYYQLMKKYHPDKNENKDNDYAKFITSYWDEYCKTTYTKVRKSP